jgi:hypothetical protein
MIPSWKKHGLRVAASGDPLQRSHAMLPTPILLGEIIRVFYASCDENLRGRVFYSDLSAFPPYGVIRSQASPALDVGVPGSFDCDGVNPSQVVRDGASLLLYYIGWRRGSADIPYTLVAGVARSRDDGSTFEKLGEMLPLSEQEPLFRTAPFVFREGERWCALYIGGGRFVRDSRGKSLPIYSLRRVFSTDGLTWPDSGEELLAPRPDQGEIGFGRPVLWRDAQDRRLLVLSRRTGDGYELMQSSWSPEEPRKIELRPLITPGPEFWDSMMTCFGAFCATEIDELLFYNGNRFGLTGFGLASRPVARETLPLQFSQPRPSIVSKLGFSESRGGRPIRRSGPL